MRIFETLELAPAMREVSAVFEHGVRKHAGSSWRLRPAEYHDRKSLGHRARPGRCTESGMMHRAHHIARELILLQLELEGQL